MLTAVAGKRQVLFSWSPLPVTQHNGVLTNYTISCSPSPSSLPQSLFHHQNTSTTVAGFSPNTLYTCSVAAWNTQGSGPPAYTTFTTVEDCKNTSLSCSDFHVFNFTDIFFQLRLGGLLSSCPDLVVRGKDYYTLIFWLMWPFMFRTQKEVQSFKTLPGK